MGRWGRKRPLIGQEEMVAMSARTAEVGPAAACRDRQHPTLYRTLKEEEDGRFVDHYDAGLSKSVQAIQRSVWMKDQYVCESSLCSW